MSNFGPPSGPPPGPPTGPPPGAPQGPPQGPPPGTSQQPQSPPWAQQAYVPSGPPLATWGRRACAALIDAALLVPFYLVAGVGGGLAQESGFFVTAFGLLVTLVGWVGLVGFAVWNHVLKQGRTGYTLGKSVIGIKLVKQDSSAVLGAPTALVRQLLHVLDGFCFVGYLWPLLDDKRQTFADKIISTLVVVEPRS
ncbi:proline-rich antigen (36 kDa antigen) [Nocardioides luteus]|uniref:Proline-rich antigen n=2 Tax=Nocardioides luteus TaxID=1844 RepID=A0ABQ5SQ94_9ACTN|nr:proline-rich antigen (36 kDa antigen) [Nocardioides luteus]GLJ66322.1 proline-rich antigen [Nocardioides luteus]